MIGLEIDYGTFLRTGALGSIRFDAKEEELPPLIGKADRLEKYPGDRSLHCYGPIEVRFTSRSITVISVLPSVKLPWKGITVQGFYPSPSTTMVEIQEFCRQQKIEIELGHDGRMIRSAAGVWIVPTPDNLVMNSVKEYASAEAFLDDYYRVKK